MKRIAALLMMSFCLAVFPTKAERYYFFEHIKATDGLPSNVITNILQSDDGNLWISTLNGLSRLNTNSGEFKNYYHYDGLQENEFHANASMKDRNGRLWFGGIKGLTSFLPHVVDQRSHPVPPLHLSNLSVMNRPVDYDPSLGEGNVWLMMLIGILLFLGVSFFNVVAVKKKVASIWMRKS